MAVPPFTTAAGAIAGGLDPDVAERFYAPDGILPRMMILAWGWDEKQVFKSPSDAAWWKRPYAFPLWKPLTTLMHHVDLANIDHDGIVNGDFILWNESLAKGDSGELSHALPEAVADATEVKKSPSPRFLIPPGEDQLPIPTNVKGEPKPKPQPKPKSTKWDAFFVLVLIYGTYRVIRNVTATRYER